MPFSFQVQQMPDWYRVPMEAMLARSRAIAEEPHRHYGGQRVFQLPPELMRASELSRMEGIHRPHMESAGNFYNDVAGMSFPMAHHHYINPYEQHVIRNMENESMRTFGEKILPALEGKFVRLGKHGGSKHRDLALRAARDLQHDLSMSRTKALHQGYTESQQHFNQDQARRLMAARELASLGQMKQAGHIADIATLEQMGHMKRQQGQLGLDVAYQDYLRESARPMEGLSAWSSAMHGLPTPMATHYFENPLAAPPQFNTVGQLGQLASAGLAMRQGMR